MVRKINTIFIITILSVIFICPVYSTDWTKWRGPNANGISEETGWNPKALNDEPNILWETDIGFGHSTVTVRGDYLYTMGNKTSITGNDTTDMDIIYCLNANTGKEIWRYANPHPHMQWPGPGATPVLDESRLYTISRNGDYYCLDAMSGKVIWKRNLVDDDLSRIPNWGFCSSALIVDDLLILNANESGVALNKKTGEIVWKSEAGRGNLSTPVLFQYDNKELAAILGERNLNVVDVKTGDVVWQHRWTNYTDPIVLEDKIVLSGNGLAVLEKTDKDPKELFNHRNIRSTSFISFVIIDNYAYGVCADRREQHLQCVDIHSGEVKWSRNLGQFGYGSLMAADSKLIYISGTGDLIIAEATPEKYDVISSAKLFTIHDFQSYPNGRPNWCWTAPVLANGHIYVRTTYGNLICVDVEK